MLEDYKGGEENSRLQAVLFSNEPPNEKVRQIIKLGYDDEVASDLVERYYYGRQMPVYYEKLGAPDYNDELDEVEL